MVLTKLVKEILPLLFFFFFFLLCVVFHTRTRVMPDMNMIFDNWWYFIHRLNQGELAQWNPFQLLGMVAVQFNWVAVSIFTPFLIGDEFTLETERTIHIWGTFLSFASIYVMGRVLSFGRLLALLPCVLFAGNYFFRYYAGWAYQSTHFLFYPLAFACYLRWFSTPIDKRNSLWILLASLFLGLSFFGTRLEFMVYASFFITFGHIVAFFYFGRSWKVLALGAGLLAWALSFNAWELAYLLEATLNNIRIQTTALEAGATSTLFWSWFGRAVLYQAPLCVALVLTALTKVCGKPAPRVGDVVFTLCFGLGLLFVLYKFNPYSFFHEISMGRPLTFGLGGCLVLVFCWIWRTKGKTFATRREVMLLTASLFVGLQMVQYFHYQWWTYNNPQVYQLWLELVFGLLLMLGAARMVWFRNAGILVFVVVGFMFFGEPGHFILTDILGLPWLPLRAQNAFYPLIVFMLLEGADWWGAPVKSWLERRQRLLPVVTLASFVGLGFLTDRLLLPQSETHFLTNFPFQHESKEEVEARIKGKGWLDDSYVGLSRQRAGRLRKGTQNHDSFTRVDVKSRVPDWPRSRPYEILPSYSQVRNNIPVYTSDIPGNAAAMFQESYNPSVEVHPEVSLFNRTYYLYKIATAGGDPEKLNTDYHRHVVLEPEVHVHSLHQQLIANEKSKTERVFTVSKVRKFEHQRAEYSFLKQQVDMKYRPLGEVLTTSDPRFTGQNYEPPASKARIRFTKDTPEHIELRVDAPSPTYLVLLDLFSQGWSATVNGKEQTIYRGYVGARFVELPKGLSSVVFSYQVPGLKAGFFLSFLSIIVWGYCLRNRRLLKGLGK